ncbi:unnamed protein product, partial [Porites evermanni]
MGKSFDYSFLHPWLGTDMAKSIFLNIFIKCFDIYSYSFSFFFFLSDGSKWKTRRRLITPTFHFRILNDFIQVFEEQAAILVKHLE